jgi:hypothetical protein
MFGIWFPKSFRIDGGWKHTSWGENYVLDPAYNLGNWFQSPIELPLIHPDLPDGFPALLSKGEINLLHSLLKHYYTGKGEVVDLGAFLGGSAYACALGMKGNSRRIAKEGRIHSFDIFELCYENPAFNGLYRAFGLEQRANTLPIYNHILREYASYTRIYQGSVELHTWPEQLPIEILFVDLAKSPDTDNFVAEEFFPKVMNGGLIIQQDMLTGEAPWISTTMGLLYEWGFVRLWW